MSGFHFWLFLQPSSDDVDLDVGSEAPSALRLVPHFFCWKNCSVVIRQRPVSLASRDVRRLSEDHEHKGKRSSSTSLTVRATVRVTNEALGPTRSMWGTRRALWYDIRATMKHGCVSLGPDISSWKGTPTKKGPKRDWWNKASKSSTSFLINLCTV